MILVLLLVCTWVCAEAHKVLIIALKFTEHVLADHALTILLGACRMLPINLLHSFTHEILQHLLLGFSERRSLRCGPARKLGLFEDTLKLSIETVTQL